MLSKREQTKKHIIELAAPLFNKKGYAATSMSDLVTETGLTKGSIYGNFKDKEEVAELALKHNLDKLRKHFINELARHAEPKHKLLAYCTVYRKIYSEVMENGGCPMLNAAIDADYNNERLKTIAKDAVGRWLKSFEILMLEGQEKGQVKPGILASDYSRMVLSLIEGSIMLAKLYEDASFVLRNIDRMEELIRTEILE